MIHSIHASLFAMFVFIIPIAISSVAASDAPSIDVYHQHLSAFGSEDTAARTAAQEAWQKVCFDLGRADYEGLRKLACEKMCASLLAGQPRESALFILRQLERIGRDESVAVEQKLTAAQDVIVADAARRALQSNRSNAAHDALLSLLETLKDDAFRINIINSLGYRAELKSVGVLSKLLTDGNSIVRLAAARALSCFKSAEGSKAVFAAWKTGSGDSRDRLAESVITCSVAAIDRGELTEAASMLNAVYEQSQRPSIQASAFQGRLMASGDDAAELILKSLKGDRVLEQQLAIGHVRHLTSNGISLLLKGIASVPSSGQAALLIALGNRREKAALPAIENACQSADPTVKLAAVTALGDVGTVANTQFLLEQLTGSDELRAAASMSLSRIFDDQVDTYLFKQLASLKADDQRGELISILSARNAPGVAQVIIDSGDLVSSNPETRKRATGVLNRLGDAGHIPALITSMTKIPAAEHDNTSKTIVNICNRIPTKDDKAIPLVKMYSSSTSEHHPNLLAVAGRVGGKAASEFISSKITSNSPAEKDAAITAICNWPDDTVTKELLSIAEMGDTDDQRVRAVRALARVVVLPTSQHSLDEQLEILRQTIKLATKDEERKLIIDRAKAIGLKSTVEFVRSYLKSATLGQQAESSLVHLARIRELRQADQSLRIELERIEKESLDQKLRERAKQLLLDY